MGYTVSFDELYDKLLEEEKRLHDAKRNDYTGGGDPLANYKDSAASIDVPVWKVLLSRMREKEYRLKVLLGGTERKVANETVLDTCLDIGIIAKLIAVWYELEGKVQPNVAAPSEVVTTGKFSIHWSDTHNSWQVTDRRNSNVYKAR